MNARNGLAAAMAALCLVACGGGGDVGGGGTGGPGGAAPSQPSADPPPDPPAVHLKVVGDSLSDSGTFGIKFTVQGTPAYSIWIDKLAAALQVPVPCSYYTGLGGPPGSATTTCSNHAVGGGRINTPGRQDSTPLSIVQQLRNLNRDGSYGPNDLLLVNGGANDLADLIQDYLKVTSGDVNFVQITSELLTSGEGAGFSRAWVGEAYAAKLADALADAVTAHALDLGAQRVVVLTVPDLARTPRFTGLMKAMQQGGGAGPIVAAEVHAMANGWSRRFNDRLKARFDGQSRVQVLDFHAELNRWMDTPGAYGLTNTTQPACPSQGRGFMGIPDLAYDIYTCSDAALSGAPPVGESGPDWWKTYLFADDFHGTPRAHELLGEFAVRSLEVKGWK